MSFRNLETHYRKISHLAHTSRIVGWDEAVMMPKGGAAARAEAIATLEGTIHELSTAPQIGEWIARAKSEALAGEQAARLREMERVYVRATALPTDLVEASSRAQIRCEQAWRTQRSENDFLGHAPLLEEVLRLRREQAVILARSTGTEPYDALIQEYEPGMTSARLDQLFTVLERELVALLPHVLERQAAGQTLPPEGPFPVAKQRELALTMMRAIGFDFAHGRLDTSHHPFCGGVPEDVRITTRYREEDFLESLMGVLHETGHAKYEQRLPLSLRAEPAGQARSMGIHESQSLFQEMQVCRSRAFIRFLAPALRDAFPESARREPAAFEAEALYRLVTRVRRGKIRVEADEVTYPLHVILRFRLERDLIEQRLRVRELPQAWDAAMRSLLDISTLGDDRNGCMQDVHWPSGAFGYFPSYTLGALLAAQLRAAAAHALPELDRQIERGELAPLDAFLEERIWRHGSLLDTEELILKATGQPLSATAFLGHIKQRYLQS